MKKLGLSPSVDTARACQDGVEYQQQCTGDKIRNNIQSQVLPGSKFLPKRGPEAHM